MEYVNAVYTFTRTINNEQSQSGGLHGSFHKLPAFLNVKFLLPGFSRSTEQVIEVYFRTIELHQAGMKKPIVSR